MSKIKKNPDSNRNPDIVPTALSSDGELAPLSCERQKAVRQMEEAVSYILSDERKSEQLDGTAEDLALLDRLLWDTLLLFQNFPFYTAKGLAFTYTIKGNEMFVSRKDKSITKSTVILAFHTALKLLQDGPISGPKKLGTFGASYLYPVFCRIGILPLTK